MKLLSRPYKTRKNVKRRGGGGNQLPPAEIALFSLPTKRPGVCQSIGVQKGGNLPQGYVGPTWGNLIITNFRISDNDIISFQRINSNVDCAASAMQIIGLIDNFTANIIRIMLIAHKQMGLYAGEIEAIFSLKTNKKFVFMPTTNADELVQYINAHLLPGCVVFCGATYGTLSHVFLIGRHTSGTFVKIDPQSSVSVCNLAEESCKRSMFKGAKSYFLLFNYEGEFTQKEGEIMGFTYDKIT